MATISTIKSSGGDYATLTAWEAAKQGTLSDIQQAEVYNDFSDGLDDQLTIDGSTTTSSFYFVVTSAVSARHTGKAATGAKIKPTANGTAISLQDPYCEFSWLEVTNWGQSGNYGSSSCISVGSSLSPSIHHNICHDNRGNGNHSGIGCDREGTIYRNIVYNVQETGISVSNYGTRNINNNTVYNYNRKNNGSKGIVSGPSSGGGNCKNNLVIAGANGGDCFSLSGSVTKSNNAGSDTTGDLDNLTAANEFVNTTAGSEDLRLKAGATSIDAGANLGSPYDVDINGITVSGTWDIGAYEYVASAGATTGIMTTRTGWWGDL